MKKIFLNIGLMIAVALIIGWLSMLWLDVWTRHGDTISVPAVRTLAYDKAISLLEAEGLKGIVADSRQIISDSQRLNISCLCKNTL